MNSSFMKASAKPKNILPEIKSVTNNSVIKASSQWYLVWSLRDQNPPKNLYIDGIGRVT